MDRQPRIFDFHNYRQFLKSQLEHRKSKNPRYSFRAFAARMGINSSTLLRIMDGQRNISAKTLPLFIKHLKLGQREAEYFELLVSFDQTRDTKTRVLLREQINQFRKTRLTRTRPEQHEYYDKWYHTVIREYISLVPCTAQSYKDIARNLSPAITAPMARTSLKLLEKLNLIEKGASGFYCQTSTTLTTGDSWDGLAVHSFQKQMSSLSEKALDAHPKEERDVSTVTMSLSEEGLRRIREKLKESRRELIQIALDDEARNKIYQLNFHLFPVTREIGDETA